MESQNRPNLTHNAESVAGRFPCCRHCPDDPTFHAENPPNSHEVSCSTCDSDGEQRTLSLVESREWAERFLAEWSRPYFGDDRTDAVACVQRAAIAANRTSATPPGEARCVLCNGLLNDAGEGHESGCTFETSTRDSSPEVGQS